MALTPVRTRWGIRLRSRSRFPKADGCRAICPLRHAHILRKMIRSRSGGVRQRADPSNESDAPLAGSTPQGALGVHSTCVAYGSPTQA